VARRAPNRKKDSAARLAGISYFKIRQGLAETQSLKKEKWNYKKKYLLDSGGGSFGFRKAERKEKSD